MLKYNVASDLLTKPQQPSSFLDSSWRIDRGWRYSWDKLDFWINIHIACNIITGSWCEQSIEKYSRVHFSTTTAVEGTESHCGKKYFHFTIKSKQEGLIPIFYYH